MFDPNAYSDHELMEAFHEQGSFNKHLLTLYSIAIGTRAKRVAEIGIGRSTKALRLAAEKTGATLYSCDVDTKRFSGLLDQQTDRWKLFLCPSEKFLEQVEGPLDLALHDGAHDYYQVKLDLELLLPKMRTFGIICVHDTQQTELADEMLKAIRDATREWRISITHMPYGCGLTLIRVEEGRHPAIEPEGQLLSNGVFDTSLTPFPMQPSQDLSHSNADTSFKRWLRWRLRKIVKGY